MPSIPGMLISRKTMSGSCVCARATASRPLLASPTITSSGQASFRRAMICSRIRRSSSAITAVGVGEERMLSSVQGLRGGGNFVGHLDSRTRTARGRHADDELGAIVVHGLQPLSNIGQADATFGFRHEADSIVEHMNCELTIDDFGTDLQPPAFGLGLQSMLDGVFDEGLQHHRGEYRRLQAFRNTD